MKMDLIAGFMENYLALDAKEELDFQAALDKIKSSKERESVMELMTSWERKGRQEGRQEGRLDNIKRQLHVLIGKLSSSQQRKLDCLEEAQLTKLAEALLDFSTTEDLDRWLAQNQSGD